jgi:hypothetical protein
MGENRILLSGRDLLADAGIRLAFDDGGKGQLPASSAESAGRIAKDRLISCGAQIVSGNGSPISD